MGTETMGLGQIEDKGEAPKLIDTSQSKMDDTAVSETAGQKKITLNK